MEICKRCKCEATCSAASESDFCLNYEPRPLTNADRIRAMTDEELATFLTNNQIEVFRKVVKEMCNLLDISFPYEELTKEVTAKYEEMKKEQLDWLKQEVKE